MGDPTRKNPHNLPAELHRDLNLIILAVTFGMAYMTVYNGPSLNSFIRSLGGGDFVFAVIMAMPVLTGLLQLVASAALQKAGRRKGMFIAAGLIQRLILLPVALVPIVVPERFQGMRILLVLVLIGVNAGAQAFMSIIFNSWVGALVPNDIRGRYFSRRALISTVTSLIVAPLSGLFLDRVPGPNGYAILFGVVAVLGALDIVCFFWITDPPMVLPAASKPIHQRLLQPLRDRNYRQFILYATFVQFSLNLAASFFTPYMREYCHMSMLSITVLTQMVGSASTILFIGRIGRMIDRFGTKTVLTVAAWAVTFLPLFWMFATPGNYIVPILVVQLIAGILWPAFDMGLMNLSIWLAPEEDRPTYLAGYAFVMALFGILPGQLLGGAVMEGFGGWLKAHPLAWFTGLPMAPFHLLLFLTFFGRLLATVFLLRRIHDADTRGTPWDVVRAFFVREGCWLRKRA